jgi:hypothetical protein
MQYLARLLSIHGRMLLLLLTPCVIFMAQLFVPTQQLIVTPDFGISDAWDDGFARKVLFDRALSQMTIPVWTNQLADGFPLLAEGQTGMFFAPNLVLFSLFSTAVALNLSLLLAMATAGIGMYLWCIQLRLPTQVALFAGITMSLSGIIMPQLVHAMHVQSMTLIPLLFALTHWTARVPTLKKAMLLSIVTSQQLLTGFPQGAFITHLFLTPYALYWARRLGTRKQLLPHWGGMLVATILLSAVQLLPSMEFQKHLTDSSGFAASTASFFSYPLTHLRTFIDPFLLGNPKEGTYPPFTSFDGSIFWENTGFIGIIPLVGIVFSLLFVKARTRLIWFWVAAIVALLLMLGKYSPLYLVYSYWPFTLFRVPSRFLWVFVPFLTIIAAVGITEAIKRIPKHIQTLVISILILVQTVHLLTTWWNYHAIVDAQAWQTPPETLSLIRPEDKLYTIGSKTAHNALFLTDGWKNIKAYKPLHGLMPANSNLIWDRAQHGVYSGRYLRRSAILDSLLAAEITEDAHVATISARAQQLLSFTSITTITSALELDTTMPRVASVSGIGVYRNPDALPLVHSVSRMQRVSTVTDVQRALNDPLFDPRTTAFVEGDIPVTLQEAVGVISDITDEPTRIRFLHTSEAPGLVVINTTWYPGWRATIDGTSTPIYPANIKFMGVVIPEGEHTIDLSYTAQTFYTGLWVSGGALSVIVLLMGAPMLFSSLRTGKTILLPFVRLPHNPDRPFPHRATGLRQLTARSRARKQTRTTPRRTASRRSA